ncbi:hypothetical protein [Rhodococcus sp. H29-C3]|uniref:hypothetical protein n=1 Tax=Rhodococcus sp. H29-C3 TaxID=3046307 RepID=UPI0024BA9231|nr:hypothetical protein [Rhodococcus sp. H29-C3]MDJ0362241.1 hypothetical protein [Rhodococcus sp. H29-C3]
MDHIVVLTIDFGDDGVVVAATRTEQCQVHSLTLIRQRSDTDRTRSPAEVIFDGIDQVTVASARLSNVLAPPDDLVLTHPQHWTPAQVQTLHEGADAAGFPDSRVHVHPKPFIAAPRS